MTDQLEAQLAALNGLFSQDASEWRPPPKVVLLTDMAFWEMSFGSHVRVQALARAIGQFADLTIFAFRTVTPKIKTAFDAMHLNAKLVSYKDWEAKSSSVFVPNISLHPFFSKKAKPSWIQAAFNFLAISEPDFVVIEYIDRGYLLDAVPQKTRTIIDTIDVMSDRTVSFAYFGKTPSIALSSAQEAELLQYFDAVLAISRYDATFFRDRLGLRNVVNAFQPARPGTRPIVRDTARRVLMLGANSEANNSGLQWFLDQVWPLIGEDLELHIVGSVNVNARSQRSVVFRGFVPNLAALHQECDIAINPIYFGGGVKLKTIDALGFGLPCVTTSEGARGLEGADGSGLIIARSRSEFVVSLKALAASKEKRSQMSVAAQAYAGRQLSPGCTFRDLILFLSHA